MSGLLQAALHAVVPEPWAEVALLHCLGHFCCERRTPALGSFLLLLSLTSTTGCSETHLKRGLGGDCGGPVLSKLLSMPKRGLGGDCGTPSSPSCSPGWERLCGVCRPFSQVSCVSWICLRAPLDVSPVWTSTLQNTAYHPDLLAQSEVTPAALTAQSP